MKYIRKIAPDCPADLFISLYKNSPASSPRKVFFSKRAVQFFNKHADSIVVHGRKSDFFWKQDDINPELRVRLAKKVLSNKHRLLWLDEKDSFTYSANNVNNDKQTRVYIDRDEER